MEIPVDENTPVPWKGFEPENRVELTPEQVSLYAVVDRLDDVRHKLFFAARVRCSYRVEVRALHDLAQDLHLKIARELSGEVRP